MFYQKSDNDVVASILDKFETPLFKSDIYGQSLSYLNELQVSDIPVLEIFAYDWRQSNIKSAYDLNQWLCEKKRDVVEGRKIVFIAHSMGGLVLKKWLKAYHSADWCEGTSEKLNIERVIFLGTPHYGSPKSIRAFATGFTLVADGASDSSIFGRLFGSADQRTVSQALNKYGPSFPSVYELLPIYKSACAYDQLTSETLRTLQTLPPPLRLKSLSTVEDIDLFSVNAWRRFQWPSKLPWPREQYYDDVLKDMLDGAYNFLCDLIDYRVETHHPRIAVTYVYGKAEDRNSPNTEQSFDIELDGSTWRFGVSTDNGKVSGDGTVPEVIAGDLLRADPNMLRRVSSSHEKLLDDESLYNYLQLLLRQARANMDRELLSRDSPVREAAIERMISTRTVASLPPNLQVATSEEFRDVRDANDEVLQRLKVTADDVFKLAAKSKDPDVSRELYSVVSVSDALSRVRRGWALNNQAFAEFNNGNFGIAEELARTAREVAIEIPGKMQGIDLIGTATNNEAWAKYNLGDSKGAKILFEMAEKLGVREATIGLKTLAISPDPQRSQLGTGQH